MEAPGPSVSQAAVYWAAVSKIVKPERFYNMKKRITAFIFILTVLFSLPIIEKMPEYTVYGADTVWSYRSQLSEQEAVLYDEMSEKFQGGSASFTYSFPTALEFESTQEAQTKIREMFFRAYEAFYRDHPQIFWIGKSNITISPQGVQEGNKIKVSNADVSVEFTSITELAEKQQALEAKVQEIIKNAGASDFDKVRAFHDYLTNNCQYDEPAAQTPKNYPLSYEAFGALVYGNATCEGYSKAFKLLCDRAGISCVLVGGNAGGESHMWNYVQVDGAYYLVDATFDDPVGGEPRYTYFLKGKGSTPEYVNQGSFTQNFNPHFTDPALSQEDYPLPDMSQKPSIVSAETPNEDKEPCQINYTRTRNGNLSIQYTYSSGSLDNGQIVPYGIVLKIVAFPNAGYQLESISVDMGGTTKTIEKGVSYLTVTSDCEVSASFKKIA